LRGISLYLGVPPDVVEPVEVVPVLVPDVPPRPLLPVPEAPPFMEGLVFVAPMLLPVVPWFMAPLVFEPGEPPVPIPPVLPDMEAPPAAPPDAPLLEPPPEPPPLCASARVEVKASVVANASVESFMVISSWFERRINRPPTLCSAFLQRERSRQVVLILKSKILQLSFHRETFALVTLGE
jgi:hypothetical protein